jgi:uncharacterized protein (TIGR02099 family)
MILTAIKKTISLFITLALTLLMLVAVYVSAGRQLLPYAAQYREDVEASLSATLGQQVQIGVLEGSWRRFNPVLSLQQVLIFPAVSSPSEQLVLLDNISLELDALGSLLQWRLVLHAVDIRNPELALHEDANGRWQLSGFAVNPATPMDPDQLLALSSRVSNLSLSDLRLTLLRQDGRRSSFERGRLRLQNQSTQRFLHLEMLQSGVAQPLSIAAEVTGASMANLTGTLYARLPQTDYSEMLRGMPLGDQLQLTALAGGGEVWASVQAGRLDSVRGRVALQKLGVERPAGGPSLELGEARADVFLRRLDGSEGWELWARDLSVQQESVVWENSNAYVQLVPGDYVELRADRFDLGFLSALVTRLDLLQPATDAQLTEHNPRGDLQQLTLRWQFPAAAGAAEAGVAPAASAAPRLSLTANLNDVSVSARNGVPSLWGMDGFVEMTLDASAQHLKGMAEVDSSRFMMQLPDLFTDMWVYDRVNGRVNFALDLTQGQHLRLVSSVIVAENDMLKGHARFATDFRKTSETDRTATLELMVGLADADISRKSVYLPRGPRVRENLRNAMNWIDGAIVGGRAFNSGLIYRGSMLPGAAPQSRTLQLVFNVDEGTLVDGRDWPALEQLQGHVVIADRNIDIHVESGETLGLAFDATSAAIRPDAQGQGSWLSVTGLGSGTAEQAIDFLTQAPATRGLGSLLQTWEGRGTVNLGLGLSFPLAVPSATPVVDVAVQLQDNSLFIPEFDLRFDGITGALRYNTQTGLQGKALQAQLFEQPVTLALNSGVDAAHTSTTRVDLQGQVGIDALARWPRQSRFVVDLLSRVQGEMDYLARLDIVQPAADAESAAATEARRRLSIESTLQGVVLDYPAPFAKPAEQAMDFRLGIDFLDGRQQIQAGLADLVSLALGVDQGRVRDGLVYLGAQDLSMNVRRLNASTPGIDVVGSLPQLQLDEWITALAGNAAGSGTGTAGFSSLREVLNLADVTIGSLQAFGQTVPALNVQVSPRDRAWHFALASDVVTGEISLPYARSLPLEVKLQHLHLPAPPEPEPPVLDPALAGFMGPPEPPERVDALAGVDPRRFLAMQFAADSIMRGDADYGRWSFALHPTPAGAEFTDVLIDARGVRAGREAEEGRFLWTYDGERHHSYMNAVLEAEDLGAVLSAFGYAPSLQSTSALFNASLDWPGSPAFFASKSLSGNLDMRILEGRFLQGNAGAANRALKLISIINFDAVVRRLRFSDDLLRSGLSYEQILGQVSLNQGVVSIQDRLQIIGPASLFQITGDIDLARQTIDGSMYITLPISDNIPWLSGIAVLNNLINWQVAVGVFLFDQIFGDQVDSLTSAQYTLQGPWAGLEPRLNQVFGTPASESAPASPGGSPAAPATAPAAPGAPQV